MLGQGFGFQTYGSRNLNSWAIEKLFTFSSLWIIHNLFAFVIFPVFFSFSNFKFALRHSVLPICLFFAYSTTFFIPFVFHSVFNFSFFFVTQNIYWNIIWYTISGVWNFLYPLSFFHLLPFLFSSLYLF